MRDFASLNPKQIATRGFMSSTGVYRVKPLGKKPLEINKRGGCNMFFKKKEKEEKENFKDTKKEEKEEKKDDPNKKEMNIQADIEKLKARSEVQEELGKFRDEKLLGIHGQLGELRSTIVEGNKRIKELEGRALKSIELVESVQPQKLMEEVKKQDIKFEMIKNKLESYYELLVRYIGELKEIRKKIEAFRGLEEVIRLSHDVKGDLDVIKKIETSTKKSADKIESILIQAQTNFVKKEDFDKIEERLDQLNNDVVEIKKSVRDELMLLLNDNLAVIKKDIIKSLKGIGLDKIERRLNYLEKGVLKSKKLKSPQ